MRADLVVLIAQALADGTRIAVLGLVDGHRGVREIARLLGYAPSSVANHLGVLRRAGLVVRQRQRDGRLAYERLPGIWDALVARPGQSGADYFASL